MSWLSLFHCTLDTGSSLFVRYSADNNPFGEEVEEEESEDVMDTSMVWTRTTPT